MNTKGDGNFLQRLAQRMPQAWVDAIDRWFARSCEIEWGKEHNNHTFGANRLGDTFHIDRRPDGSCHMFVWPLCPEGKRYCDCRRYGVLGDSQQVLMAQARRESYKINGMKERA